MEHSGTSRNILQHQIDEKIYKYMYNCQIKLKKINQSILHYDELKKNLCVQGSFIRPTAIGD